jgi:folate-binding protein YgfZ
MKIVNLNDTKGLICVGSGPKAKSFLQGQLTSDIRSVNEQQAALAAHCDAKGRMQSLSIIFMRESAYYLLTTLLTLQQTQVALQKYAIFSKLSLTVISSAEIYGFFGKALENCLYPERSYEVTHHEHFTLIKIPGSTATQINRYYCIDFSNKKIFQGVDPETLWHQADIIDGIPQLYPNTIGEFLPHYLNLPKLGAVSFNKGCYTGQEIIARMEHRGEIKQHLRKVFIDTTELGIIGEKIFSADNTSANIGQMVDGIIVNNQFIGLAILKDTALSEMETNVGYIKSQII